VTEEASSRGILLSDHHPTKASWAAYPTLSPIDFGVPRMRFLLTCSLLLAASFARADDWVRFRGPDGNGISTETNLPTKWSATENVVWKTKIPGVGWSSPIIQGKRVFLTAVTDGGKSCHILGLDRDTGAILWDREVLKQTPTHKRPENSDATPTPTTDGERVYAVFGEGGIAAVTVGGEPVWTYTDVKFYSHHGLSASPIVVGDVVIMPYDGSSKKEPPVGWQKPWDGSFVVGLDRTTGSLKWKTPRGQSRLAHVTPITLKADGKDIVVSPCGELIQALEPETGKILWNVKAIGEGVSPSPVFGDGVVFAASGFGATTLRAVKVDGSSGDATRPVVWETKKGVTTIPSPIYVRPNLYMVTEKGAAYCLDAATGKQIWQERLPGTYGASPVYAGGKLYFLNEAGETTVVEPGEKMQIVASNPLGERCQASMAVSDGRLFIRTSENLYCIGKGK
jgi:outer membrane protein assembly factor BamB